MFASRGSLVEARYGERDSGGSYTVSCTSDSLHRLPLCPSCPEVNVLPEEVSNWCVYICAGLCET